jgi:hypothetical protein
MKNITLAIDEDLLADVRRYAALQGTTVNAIVRGHLEGIVRHHRRAVDAVSEMRELSEASPARLGSDFRWTREDAYGG